VTEGLAHARNGITVLPHLARLPEMKYGLVLFEKDFQYVSIRTSAFLGDPDSVGHRGY